MAHAQKPDFVFSAKRTSPFKSAGGRQFSRLLAGEVCAISGSNCWITPCSEVVWRVLATHCIRQFPLHVPSRASPHSTTFQLNSTTGATKPVGIYVQWRPATTSEGNTDGACCSWRDFNTEEIQWGMLERSGVPRIFSGGNWTPLLGTPLLQRTVFINKIKMLKRTWRKVYIFTYYGKFDYSFSLGKDSLCFSCALDCLCFSLGKVCS